MLLRIVQKTYNTLLFYGGVLILPYSPGTIAWKFFKHKRGVVPLWKRDLICDTTTLYALPKSENSLDEFTTAFSPFIPLLTLNGQPWKERRKILADGLRRMNHTYNFNSSLPSKKGDIYWDVFESFFRIGFELVYARVPTEDEIAEMYPGVKDINQLIKRQIIIPDLDKRWKLYNRVLLLNQQQIPGFIFAGNPSFFELGEIDQVSLVVEDLLTSICIQCTDLVCHMILEYPRNPESFRNDSEHAIDETLRLYPLTDIWTRKAYENQRAWIASLMQLNRAGWDDPDSFIPDRWKMKDHPPLISWGFDARSCPATKIGYHLARNYFQKNIIENEVWIIPASNYVHDRTFIDGCQVWLDRGKKPEKLKWHYRGKWKNLVKQWFSSRFRLIDQGELW